MKPMLTRMLLVLSLLGVVACGDDAGLADETPDGTEASDPAPSSEESVDNCTLVTDEEVSTLAGDELVAGEDSPLGCPFTAPGESVADVRVVGAVAEGGAQAVAERAFPNAAEIIPVDVGDDTVAVTDPSGGAIASIITASGDRVVELSVIFIDVPPDDPARIEEAATLAVTALERFGG
jgi:hypothetical protein